MGGKTVFRLAAPYGLAMISVLLAIGLKELLDPWVEQDLSPFLFFAAPVVITAWYGGVWPGIFCVSLVGLLASSTFIGQEYLVLEEGAAGYVRLIMFLLEGVLISVLAGVMHEARRRAQQSRRHAEEAYREAQRHVEELTRTKDALLEAQAGLRRAIADAQNASRAKSEFLANVSHELRTPLNAIIGMTDLCLQEELSADVRENLTVARESAGTLMRLLNDLLDFSKIESGRFELEATPFRLRESLEEVMKALSLRAHEKGLELALHVHSDVPDCLLGDSTRLEQVLTNLLGNALKFTERGEVVAEVGLHSQNATKVCLAFCVTDTGIGISPADQGRIFAPFTQADASTTREYGGLGLGLAIASQLIAAMEGRIWVESQPGRGSKFSFTAWFELASHAPPMPPLNVDLSPLHDAPVLVVDDHPANRRILREMLRHWRLRPVLAANAEQALAQLRRGLDGQPFPLVLLDALMPGADGFELAERIQCDPHLATAVLLMLSAADKQAFADRCAPLSVTFLEKPVAQDALAKALAAAYSGIPASEEPASRPTPHSDAPFSARVLVVEDTPANQKVMAKILEKRGHRVAAASNGRDALDLCSRCAFDAIIMDVQMPTMDGFQATAAIRQLAPTGEHQTSPDVPIIALTAHATRGFEERCLAAGMDEYLAKPVDSRRLIELVESCATGSAARFERSVAIPPGVEGAAALCETPCDALSNAVDLEGALERLAGNRGLVADMATFFLEDAPSLLDRIREGLGAARRDEVQRAAHSLKGLAKNLGVPRTVATAEAIETAAEQGDLQQAAKLLPKLDACVHELMTTLPTLQV